MEDQHCTTPTSASSESLVHDEFTKDYTTKVWPLLHDTVLGFLAIAPEHQIPRSHQKECSLVHQCVCENFGDRLHTDLIRLVMQHIDGVGFDLFCDTYTDIIDRFARALQRYNFAISALLAIFENLDRHYIQLHLGTNLEKELRDLFVMNVCVRHIDDILIGLRGTSHRHVLMVPSSAAAEAVEMLYNLMPNHMQLYPDLLGRYLPDALEPSREEDLQLYMEQAQEQRERLWSNPAYTPGDRSKKRPLEEDDDNEDAEGRNMN